MQQTINCQGRLISLENPLVMGILNVTENSFYDGGRYVDSPEKYIERVETMLSEGADIIDIGVMSTRSNSIYPFQGSHRSRIDIGVMSTRPNSIELSEKEESKRVKEVLSHLIPRFPNTIFSIDTWRSNIAQQAVDMGVSIVNDISGGEFDPAMFATIAKLKIPYILMHTSGKPDVMQQNTAYDDVVKDIYDYLSGRLEMLRALNVSDEIIDVGFGFGKTIDQNYELLRNIERFQFLDCPVLIGVSRKSMFWKLLETTPDEALNASTVAHTYALLHGANILRVHDVKEAKEVIQIINKLVG